MLARRHEPRRPGSGARLHARAVARKNLRLRNNKRIPHRAAIIFNKNWDDPYDSRIIFRSWAKTGPKGKKKWVRVEQGFVARRFRAVRRGRSRRMQPRQGLGAERHLLVRPAQPAQGTSHQRPGLRLQPMACRNGTVRQMMFIHSEQNWNNTQCKRPKG